MKPTLLQTHKLQFFSFSPSVNKKGDKYKYLFLLQTRKSPQIPGSAVVKSINAKINY